MPAADRSQSDCKHYSGITGASRGNCSRKLAPRQAQERRSEMVGIRRLEFWRRERLRGGVHLRERCRARTFGLVALTDFPRTCCRIFPTWPARFFSTCSLHTNRHGQSLLGQSSKRANCFRRSRTSAFSRTSSAARSVACRVLPFVIMNLETKLSLSVGTCHLNRSGFAAAQIFLHCRLNGILCSRSEYAGLGLGFSCGAAQSSLTAPFSCLNWEVFSHV